jgi:hypothetical protein
MDEEMARFQIGIQKNSSMYGMEVYKKYLFQMQHMTIFKSFLKQEKI